MFKPLAPENHINVTIAVFHLATVHLISFIMSLGVTSDMSLVDTEKMGATEGNPDRQHSRKIR